MYQDTMLLQGYAAAHEQIERFGVSAWVGLTCSSWYQTSLALSPQTYGFDFRNKTLTFIDDGETGINTSSWS